MKNDELIWLLIGVLLGALFMTWWTRPMQVEQVVASHASRLLVLEQERQERMQFWAVAKKAWGLCAGLGRKLLGH